jgi:hypothetical protein
MKKPQIRLLLVPAMAIAMLALGLWFGLVVSATPAYADDGSAPADETAIVDETTPTDETAIVDETTPADETTTVDETTPTDETAIVDETTPTDETTTVDETTPTDETTDATIQTDQADYLPIETPVISGSSFAPNSEVTVTVTAPDGTVTTFTATTDSDGNWTTTYTGPMGDGTFSVTATDGTSTAGTTFADAFGIEWVKSSDSASWDGSEDNTFSTTENVYAYIKTSGGTGSIQVRVYVVADKTSWSNGDSLTDLSGSYETQTLVATTNPQYFMVPIWSATLTAGDYDIVVDADRSGHFDTGEKVDQSGPAGFTVSLPTYQVTVNDNISGTNVDFLVTYTKNGTPYTNVSKTTTWTEWVDQNSTVTVSSPETPVSGGTGTRYVFNNYSPSNSVTMTSDKTITLNYTTQYYLDLNNGGHGTVTGEGWYNSGATADFGISPTMVESGGTRYEFDQWYGDHTGSYDGTEASYSVVMNNHINEEADWDETAYLLTIQTSGLPSGYPTHVYLDGVDVGGTYYDGSPYTQWFDKDTYTGTIGVDAIISFPFSQYEFDEWGHPVHSSSNPMSSKKMDDPRTYTAYFDTPPFEITGVYSSDVSGTAQDSFLPAEDVYATITTWGGSGTESKHVHIYVTADRTSWTIGDDLNDVSGGFNGVDVPFGGGTYKVWPHNTTLGNYDIVADVNLNGDYGCFEPPPNPDKVDSIAPIGFTVSKANATIVITPYNVTYDGNAHTATGTATGAGGVDLSGLLTLNGTIHTDAGDYPSDPWTFAGNAVYNSANGTVHDIINKADAIIAVTPYDVTYDGNAHTATGTATGVNLEDLSGLLTLSGTTHTDAGDYPSDPWTFTGNTNYNSANGTVHDIITAAPVALGGGPAPQELVLVIDWFGIVRYYPVTAAGVLLEDVNITSPDGTATLIIPAGTLVLDAEGKPLYLHPDADITVTMAGTPAAPAGTTFAAVYELLPSGVIFELGEAELIVKYDPATVTPGSVLVIAYYDEATGEWVEIDTAGYVVGGETISNTVSGHFAHFTYFALLVKLP